MKRRRILGAIGTLGIPGVANAGRLYGTPASVTGPIVASANPPLRLSLDSASLPAGVADDLTIFGTLWGRVLGEPEERRRFHRDPGGYLLANGIPDSLLTARDQEVKVLAALCNEELLAASVRGDYKEFLAQLSSLGLVRSGSRSVLKQRVRDVLKRNASEMRLPATSLAQLGSESGELKRFLQSKEVQFLSGEMAPTEEAVAAVPVAIAAIVVVYISVATAVTVSILAGVHISVAVAVAVVASEGCMDNTLKGPLFAGPVTGPITAQQGRSERERLIERSFAERALLGKRMLALDPARLAEAQQTARIARMLEKDDFVLEANRQLVRDEIEAFVSAAEELNLLSIPSGRRAAVMQAMKQLALRVAGLD
ncbi:hypothetical protein [Eleftheria terrae]|uniref:hypothetical protein n=1 Tax=Eleftheria terrae TaxID=1597781 RepID=UPI00263B72F1|nr:hypothetical protein [Eleftheria terrae]WKB56174.1 hypothetical protein N7L95_29470 [Eleftheria terrae]